MKSIREFLELFARILRSLNKLLPDTTNIVNIWTLALAVGTLGVLVWSLMPSGPDRSIVESLRGQALRPSLDRTELEPFSGAVFSVARPGSPNSCQSDPSDEQGFFSVLLSAEAIRESEKVRLSLMSDEYILFYPFPDRPYEMPSQGGHVDFIIGKPEEARKAIAARPEIVTGAIGDQSSRQAMTSSFPPKITDQGQSSVVHAALSQLASAYNVELDEIDGAIIELVAKRSFEDDADVAPEEHILRGEFELAAKKYEQMAESSIKEAWRYYELAGDNWFAAARWSKAANAYARSVQHASRAVASIAIDIRLRIKQTKLQVLDVIRNAKQKPEDQLQSASREFIRLAGLAREEKIDELEWTAARGSLECRLEVLYRSQDTEEDFLVLETDIEEFLGDVDPFRAPDLYADAYTMLGNLYLSRRYEATVDQLENAIQQYGAAARVWTEFSQPESWAKLQANMALAEFILGDKKTGAKRCEAFGRSLSHSSDSLRIRTQDRDFIGWSRSMLRNLNSRVRMVECRDCDDRVQLLGDVYKDLGELVVATRERDEKDLYGRVCIEAANAILRTMELVDLNDTQGLLAQVDDYLTQAAAVFQPEDHPFEANVIKYHRAREVLFRCMFGITEQPLDDLVSCCELADELTDNWTAGKFPALYNSLQSLLVRAEFYIGVADVPENASGTVSSSFQRAVDLCEQADIASSKQHDCLRVFAKVALGIADINDYRRRGGLQPLAQLGRLEAIDLRPLLNRDVTQFDRARNLAAIGSIVSIVPATEQIEWVDPSSIFQELKDLYTNGCAPSLKGEVAFALGQLSYSFWSASKDDYAGFNLAVQWYIRALEHQKIELLPFSSARTLGCLARTLTDGTEVFSQHASEIAAIFLRYLGHMRVANADYPILIPAVLLGDGVVN